MSRRPHIFGSRRARQLAGALLIGASVAAGGYAAMPARAQIAVQNQGYVPFSDAPIYYRTRPLVDPVALLQKRLDAGEVKLTYEPGHGYLKSVLELLKVPVSSQTLVFSKTSFQQTHISEQHPRALYYNDDVYVGAVHDGKTIEIISFDPVQGAAFYLIEEAKVEKPAFQRAELDCTQCHIAAGTRGVPGVLMRSVYPTAAGTVTPRSPSYFTDQKSPMKERWGGWYVTGAAQQESIGNARVVADYVAPVETSGARPIPPLEPIKTAYDPKAYLAGTSDEVALLVLAHQTQMHNLITLTNYQTRLAIHALNKTTAAAEATPAPAWGELPEEIRLRIERPAEQLLRYLLFSGEASLGGRDAKKVIASSAFAREFAARGTRDAKQRSLRDFDLHDRIFRYPCSYLIYNPAFDALPEPAKGYVYHRLLQVLTDQDQSPDFAHLSADDRQAILAILLETKPGLPAEWRDYARTNRLRTASLSQASNRK